MADIRKIIIIFVVGILFSVLVFSLIEAVYPQPEWNDFCSEERFPKPVPFERDVDCPDLTVDPSDQTSCREQNGDIHYTYDANGCAVSYDCSTCRNDYELAQKEYNQVVFYISALLALVAIFVGMYLPAKANSLNEWIGTGFMLGGTFALFFGTMQSFSDLGRYARPLIILVELILVIFVAYKKVGNLRPEKRK